MVKVWNEEQEKRVLFLRDIEKMTFKDIASEMGTTASSIKHKYIRLNQASNKNEHHHPIEKTDQVKRVVKGSDLQILEMNAGWGNLSEVYHLHGEVLALDIDKKKIDHLNSIGYEDFTAIKCDSFNEIYSHLFMGNKFDVIDLDPYGFPSRFFPHVFNLISDGILFVTFPKMGVQQINKITKEHYRVFWDMTLDDKHQQEKKIHQKMKDYAMQNFRSVHLIDTVDLGSVFRFAYKVKKESALDLVGLKVKGKNC